MQIKFIPKQPFHTILDSISPPSGLFLAIISLLCHYHLPWVYFHRDFLYMFFLYILHIAKVTRKVCGPGFTIFKELYLLFYPLLPLSTSLSIWDCWIKLSPSSVLVFLFQKPLSLAMSYLFHFPWEKFFSRFQFICCQDG